MWNFLTISGLSGILFSLKMLSIIYLGGFRCTRKQQSFIIISAGVEFIFYSCAAKGSITNKVAFWLIVVVEIGVAMEFLAFCCVCWFIL